jgi:tungstate transport system substrate-binding protein
MIRRKFFAMALPSMGWSLTDAAQPKSLSEPLRVGAEQSLIDGNLAIRLQLGFIQDTGVVVQILPYSSTASLAALERGELNVSFTHTPILEAALERQGLAHHRMLIALSDFILVGPRPERATKGGAMPADVAGIDLVAALQKISQTQSKFIGACPGTGAHVTELDAWRAGQISPNAPWYVATPDQGDALALAYAQRGSTLLERGRWLAQPLSGWAIRVQGDPRMVLSVHAMQSFRARHPAAKLFMRWITGNQGQRIVSTTPGWRIPKPG